MNYILRIGVDKLKPHPINKTIYSFNQQQQDELKKSISLLGLIEPITVTPRNQVLSGHRRLDAVKELGWEEVDCRLVDGVESESLYIVECNKTRIKTSEELLNEAEILNREYKKLNQVGRPKNGETRDGKNWSIVDVSEKLGIGASNLKKLKSIKHYEKSMLSNIDNGLISINKAYEIIRQKYIVKENTTQQPKSFENELNTLVKKYDIQSPFYFNMGTVEWISSKS